MGKGIVMTRDSRVYPRGSGKDRGDGGRVNVGVVRVGGGCVGRE